MSVISFLCNVVWFILGGEVAALYFLLFGVLLCCTIIGIPFGLQCFKMVRLVAWPYGKTVSTHFDRHPILNMFWALFFGWEIAVFFFVIGIINCITIIGIPNGKQSFKLMKVGLMPFGVVITGRRARAKQQAAEAAQADQTADQAPDAK